MAHSERRFYFRLALCLGKTVEQLLNEVSSAELSEWMAFANLEPFGPEWDNWRSANIAATVANSNRPPKTKPYSIQDFMPRIRRQKSVEEMIAIFKMLG